MLVYQTHPVGVEVSSYVYSYFRKGCSCNLSFIARSALWEPAWFKIYLLRTRTTFVGELFGLGVLETIQREKPVSIPLTIRI